MMRSCPKCGAYYAEESLAFCRADGTPLVNVEPRSEKWNEGERVIEKQTDALRKQIRRMRWRRILTMSMSVTIITMVVCVAAMNAWFYMKPNASPSPSPTASPLAPGSPTASPVGTPSPSASRSPSPVPSPAQTPSPSLSPSTSPSPFSKCTEVDPNLDKKAIIEILNSIIEKDQQETAVRPRAGKLGNNLGQLSGNALRFQGCNASVTVKYEVWREDADPAADRVETASRQKTFQCTKDKDKWSCRDTP